MPVIRIDSTTTTIPAEKRASYLATLKGEFVKGTDRGPVIFEIPLGTDCFDVLVVWQDWADWPTEDRTRLILDAYDEDRREQIAQALGVTFEEAMQQQLLPYTIVSTLEREPKMAYLVCGRDEGKVKELMEEIRKAKLANGGIVFPDGKVELRFPKRSMLDSVFAKLTTVAKDLYWRVEMDVAVSDRLGVME